MVSELDEKLQRIANSENILIASMCAPMLTVGSMLGLGLHC